MKHNKKPKRFSQNLKRRCPFSLLLKYRYNRFYSEEEDFQDHQSQEALEILDDQASELAKKLEEAMAKIEQFEEKNPKEFEAKVERLEQVLESKVNYNTFRVMKNLRLYNISPKEYVETNKLAEELSNVSLEILADKGQTKRKSKSPGIAFLGRVLRKIKEKFLGFTDFILRSIAADVDIIQLIRVIGMPLSSLIGIYVLNIPFVLISGFLFPWSVVFLTWLLRWLALKYVEKKSSNTEEAELVEKIGSALREAKPLLYKIKEGKLVDKEMVINFLKDKKELIEHITEMYNK